MKSEKYLSMAKDIRSKVEDLLDEYNTFEPSISKMFLDGQPLYEQAIKFTHLVYSFDPINPEKPDVPLNKNDAFQKVQKRRVQEKR